MQPTRNNVTPLPRRRHGWHSRYLPKVERHEASKAIKRLCRKSANDNFASSIWKWLRYFTAKHQSVLTIAGITFGTVAIAAAKIIG